MEKIGYAFIEPDRSIYPEGSNLRDFCEELVKVMGNGNLLVIYPLDEIGDEADMDTFYTKYDIYGTGKCYGHGPVEEIGEWTFTYHNREAARAFLNNLGFEESNVLIERFEELPL